MNVSSYNGRVFYSKKNGQCFECFNNEPMREVESEIVCGLMENNRKNNVLFMIVGESQVISLKENIQYCSDADLVIELYRCYGILSEDECSDMKRKLEGLRV